jgi:uncharacterized protein YndB with AHSA1/START domain
MLKKLAIGLLGLVALFVVVVATRPSTFHVERSARLDAPPNVVFPLINDFHQWPSWSPWEKLDPAMKREYSGSPQGTGAVYDWSGNDDVGVGSMRITDSQPPTRVTIALEFKEPWQATNTTLFSVAPEGDGSRVTWGMDGESNFMFKAIGLFMNMDEMVGKDFEAGLANLQRVAAAQAMPGASATATP